MSSLVKISDLVSFEPLEDCFNDVVAPELIEISSFRTLLQFIADAYLLQLPYTQVWASLTNIVLLQHNEMDDDEFVSILWFICKQLGRKELLELELDLVRGANLNKSKLLKRAQVGLLINHLTECRVSSDNCLKLSFLYDFFQVTEGKHHVIEQIHSKFVANMDGMASMTEFKYDNLIDLITAL